MRLTVNDPTVLPSLLAALRRDECVVDQVGPDSAEVVFPWLRTADDARQAVVELVFFARAWEATHPGLRVRVGPLALA
jgi:hypothetical protein